MWGTLCIKYDGVTWKYKANDFEMIYDRLRLLGWFHDDAEEVASWAEFATIGDEYYCLNPAFEIWMED